MGPLWLSGTARVKVKPGLPSSLFILDIIIVVIVATVYR